MKSYIPVLIIFLAVSIFISGCLGPSGPKCPKCSSPSGWSECNEEGIKTRSNYRCSPETNYTCESYTEEKTCETEINLQGARGVLEAKISPSLDETVKGIIKIEVITTPKETEMMNFIFAPQEVQIGDNMDTTKVIMETDTSGLDGWKAFVDTTKVDNGIYKIFVGSTYEGAPNENPWLDYTTTQVIVKN